MKHGKGVLIVGEDYKYIGSFYFGKKEGVGEESSSNGNKYTG